MSGPGNRETAAGSPAGRAGVQAVLQYLLANPLPLAILIVVASRLVVFLYAYHFPLTNELGMPVSPTRLQPWIEFEFYRRSLEMYRTMSAGELVGLFTDYYDGTSPYGDVHLIGGPVFPFLMAVFDYRDGNTVPLASFYLLLSVALSVLWLLWLRHRGVGALWLWIFALIPNPLWFMLNVTTDLVFAVLVCLFLFAYLRPGRSARDIALIVLLALACVLTRPNGAAILLFVAADMFFRLRLPPVHRWIVLGTVGGLGLAAAFYLWPYFSHELRKVSGFLFFGIAKGDYLSGLFENLPVWLDLSVSWLALAGAKLLYFTGLRPSYSGIDPFLLLLRSGAGLFFLPGLVYAIFRGDPRERLFLWIFFLPVFIGPTQDRYNLPVQGLMFYYGVLAYEALWRRLRPALRFG